MIAVIIDGGLVQEVVCDDEYQLQAIQNQILIVDLDQEGRAPDELINWINNDDAHVRLEEVLSVEADLSEYLCDAQAAEAVHNLQRYKCSNNAMATEPDGEWVSLEDVRMIIGQLVVSAE